MSGQEQFLPNPFLPLLSRIVVVLRKQFYFNPHLPCVYGFFNNIMFCFHTSSGYVKSLAPKYRFTSSGIIGLISFCYIKSLRSSFFITSHGWYKIYWIPLYPKRLRTSRWIILLISHVPCWWSRSLPLRCCWSSEESSSPVPASATEFPSDPSPNTAVFPSTAQMQSLPQHNSPPQMSGFSSAKLKATCTPACHSFHGHFQTSSTSLSQDQLPYSNPSCQKWYSRVSDPDGLCSLNASTPILP